MEALSIARSRLQPGWSWKLGKRDEYGSVEAEWSDIGEGATLKVVRGDGTPRRKLRHVYATEAEAIRACDAELEMSGRSALKFEAELAGFEPGLFAGGLIELEGLRPELGGDWHLTQVTHSLSRGLATGFRARKAFDE